jgi:hypothetical protein
VECRPLCPKAFPLPPRNVWTPVAGPPAEPWVIRSRREPISTRFHQRLEHRRWTRPRRLPQTKPGGSFPDPAGPTNYIIKNPATGHCIDIEGNPLNPGASLDAFHEKKSGN